MARTVGVTPTGHVVRITLTGGTAANVTFVKAVNRATSEFAEVRASTNSVAINLDDLSSDGLSSGTRSGFSSGDVIEFRVLGRRMGSATYTVALGRGGGQVTVTVIDVDATVTPEVNA